MRTIVVLGLLALLSGCSTVPESVRLPQDSTAVSYQQVAVEPEKSKDKIAQWGGVIANIENREKDTLLEVVHFPLRGYGRPIPHDESIGRFRVYVNGFMDPMVYQKGRLVTFLGQVSGVEEGLVGEHRYVFPTLNASGYHLWEDFDRVEVETISVWPSFHFGRGLYGPRGWFGWDGWPYQQRVIIRRRHDHHKQQNYNDSPQQQTSRSHEHNNDEPRPQRKPEPGKIDP